ncbi:hypothetical protein QT816_21560, partial [Xanthomonas citri pv. citri]
LEPIRELLDAGIQSDRNDRDDSWNVMLREQLDTAEVTLSSVLMSMGMMMLSPMLISAPFKILLFILVDGWVLVVGTLAASFNAS